mmetsp:Transcript_15227/g.29433  ORF Transcript_15227/g.29433 Transcript_15227/m.29433 type:complete len:168 (-) Transcript_15227:98-601(-)
MDSSASSASTGHVDTRNLRALRIAGAGTLQQSLAQDRGFKNDFGPPTLTMKEVWQLRGKQMQESKVTSEVKVPGAPVVAPGASQTGSFNHLNDHRTRHARSARSPRDNFSEPMSTQMEIGWHLGPDGIHKPLKAGHPRKMYPRATCDMTKHYDNMYSTNSHNIIRRW